jgi:hypothetical protein
MGRTTLAGLLILFVLPAASADPPGTRYYVTYYGSQAGVFRPRYTHSWATYTRVVPLADGSVVVEPHTISWLPASGVVRWRPFRREPGVNLDLQQTLAYVSAQGQRVAAWGPYEIDSGRFAVAVAQRMRLETVPLDYRQVDSFRRPGVYNCVTALLDADPRTAGQGYPPLRVGFRGTAAIIRRQGIAPVAAWRPLVRW